MSSEPRVNILLVDDRPENLLALEAVLGDLGHPLIKAHSGPEALKWLLQAEFALILLDVQMPGMDGFELAMQIRARPASQHTPIIFISALPSDATYLFKGYALGAVDYLLKPFEPEVLKSKVKVFIDLFQKAQAVRQLNEELEQRVRERTAELQAANEKLQEEIAERHRTEAEREQLLRQEQAAREQAEAANRTRDEFLAMISHELRTPLTPIVGWAGLLRSDRFDLATAEEALETIERCAKTQAKVIDDLLDVSCMMVGKLHLESRPVDLRPILELALAALRPAAEAKALRVEAVLDPGACPVSGDPARLQQILGNLLSNAIKFTPRGGHVAVRLERLGSQAQVVVRDTGVGIRPDFLPQVFERFRQADSATTRKFGGLGLGLTIVRHLVERHGGTVRAESPGEGQGATFRVRLPLLALPRDPGESERTRPATISQGRAARPPRLDGLRILVVDDEADTRDLIGVVLHQSGAEVVTAASAADAWRALERSRPDVLISDIGMPGADGYDLIHQVRALEPGEGIPAVALTAYAKAEDRQRALSAGYQIHLAKPIEPIELVAVVARLAGRTGHPEENVSA